MNAPFFTVDQANSDGDTMCINVTGGGSVCIKRTDEGIVVLQTSTDPEVVAAMQIHAAEVSDMAARGMQAVHEMMMKQGG